MLYSYLKKFVVLNHQEYLDITLFTYPGKISVNNSLKDRKIKTNFL